LTDARQGLLQERLIGRSNDAGLAAKLGSYLELGRTLAWDAALEDKLQAVQVAQINAALRRYLDPEAMANVYAGDFAKAATAVAK
jgi:zinc protease